jgi:hypothetical protein
LDSLGSKATSTSGAVTLNATLFGGDGGSGYHGGNGGAASLGTKTLYGKSTTGNVSVTGTLYGGGGGSGDISNHPSGGDGASVRAVDQVDGSTTGHLDLTQNATGGAGGVAMDGDAGVAGTAYSSLTRSKSAAILNISASAVGGTGGDSYSSDFENTAGMGATAEARSSATNLAGTVYSITNANGGDGGWGQQNAKAGAGGDALANAFGMSGGNSHDVSVHGHAFGGEGGYARNNLIATSAGNGGNATSTSRGTASGQSAVGVWDWAQGGDGGGLFYWHYWSSGNGAVRGGRGGDASSTANAYSTNDSTRSISSNTNALGGDGGLGVWGGEGGRGGDAGALATGSSIGDDHAVSVQGNALGGTGGNVSRSSVLTLAGDGGNATSLSTGTASGNSRLAVFDFSEGGNGGGNDLSYSSPTIGGRGGNAVSVALGSGNGSDAAHNVSVSASATGGNGGRANDSPGSLGGMGGDAMAMATGHSFKTAPVDVRAYAYAGRGGQSSNIALNGMGGAAQARAEGTGPSGIILAHANTASGPFASLIALTYGPIDRSAIVESRAAVGRAIQDRTLANGLQSAAFATGLPSTADALTVVAGNANVAAELDVGGAGDMLGYVNLGGSYAEDGSGNSQTFSSNVICGIDLSQLGSMQELKVGLLDPEYTGAGFDSLQFLIQREDSIIENQTFTTLTDALNYFDDNVLPFGAIDNSVSGSLDLTFSMQLTSSHVGDSFNMNFLIGNSPTGSMSGLFSMNSDSIGIDVIPVPEPGTLALFAMAAAAWLMWSRKHRRPTAS